MRLLMMEMSLPRRMKLMLLKQEVVLRSSLCQCPRFVTHSCVAGQVVCHLFQAITVSYDYGRCISIRDTKE